MSTTQELVLLIDEAAVIAGSQRKLAALLEMEHANLVKIKKGERPANWRVRGKLRAILGEDPAHAFMAAMAEDLGQSENADEKKAADGFKTMMAAFPDAWRKRKFSYLHQTRMARTLCTVHGTLHNRLRHIKTLSQSKHGVFTQRVQPDHLSLSL